MELEPLQDGWSRAIRAVFGAFIGMAVAAAIRTIGPEDGLPSLLVLVAGSALVFSLGTAFFGHAFWRAIAGHGDD